MFECTSTTHFGGFSPLFLGSAKCKKSCASFDLYMPEGKSSNLCRGTRHQRGRLRKSGGFFDSVFRTKRLICSGKRADSWRILVFKDTIGGFKSSNLRRWLPPLFWNEKLSIPVSIP